EQAAGADRVDGRTDLYSLGAICYEMLVGDPPHVASTVQGVLAKVRAEQPTAVHLLRPSISVAVSDVIARALAKQPGDRYASARAMRDALVSAASLPVSSSRAHESSRATPARVVGAGLALAAVAASAWMMRPRETSPVVPTAARFAVAPIPDAAIGRAPTLSPDGAALVYAGDAESGRKVFVRRVSELEARALDGTHGALAAAVSPDGRRIAFTTNDDRLLRIGVDGSDMTDLGSVFRYTNTTWLNDSAVVFDSPGERGLALVSAAGGPARVITQIDTSRHDTAHLLPLSVSDGRFIVFTALRDRSGPSVQVGELCVMRMGDAERAPAAYTSLHLIARGAFAYVDGWLLYVRADARALMAVRFDPERAEVTGEPQPVLEQEGGGIDKVTLARNGTLLYSRLVLPSNAPVIVDSAGTATPVRAGLSGAFMNPRVSRDGRRIVVQRVTSQGSDAWMYDLVSGTERRITTVGSALGPAFDAGDRDIVYVSSQDGRDALWTTPIEGGGSPRRVVASSGAFAASPSHDPNVLLFQRRVNGPWSIWRAGATETMPVAVVQAAHDAFMPTLSPDGRWLAWAASESGRYEVYLRPFPGPGSTVQVSIDGGTEPAWSPDGRTIFYRADRRMMAATISSTEPREVTRRRALFTDTFDGDMPMPHRNYDVMPDGRRFVMIAPTESRAPETIVALNWLAEFRAKVAAGPR
ncbi:MAG: PD40 domain-containing protein, partial [Gemmatimonadaceae bacterium]|nr:PD40 domain-containing protein [Gemmatimonadaceae bacterium]